MYWGGCQYCVWCHSWLLVPYTNMWNRSRDRLLSLLFNKITVDLTVVSIPTPLSFLAAPLLMGNSFSDFKDSALRTLWGREFQRLSNLRHHFPLFSVLTGQHFKWLPSSRFFFKRTSPFLCWLPKASIPNAILVIHQGDHWWSISTVLLLLNPGLREGLLHTMDFSDGPFSFVPSLEIPVPWKHLHLSSQDLIYFNMNAPHS